MLQHSVHLLDRKFDGDQLDKLYEKLTGTKGATLNSLAATFSKSAVNKFGSQVVQNPTIIIQYSTIFYKLILVIKCLTSNKSPLKLLNKGILYLNRFFKLITAFY